MTQPEALRLADALTCPTYPDWVMHIPAPWHPPAQEVRKAAAELRRLHAECNDLAHQLNESNERNGRLKAQRDALLEALKRMLHRDERNTCRHEETHCGGVLWEICDSCGAMWADDEGGKPEWEDPKEWTQARAAIKAVEETK